MSVLIEPDGRNTGGISFVHVPRVAGKWVRAGLVAAGLDPITNGPYHDFPTRIPVSFDTFCAIRTPISWLQSVYAYFTRVGWQRLTIETDSPAWNSFMHRLTANLPLYLGDISEVLSTFDAFVERVYSEAQRDVIITGLYEHFYTGHPHNIVVPLPFLDVYLKRMIPTWPDNFPPIDVSPDEPRFRSYSPESADLIDEYDGAAKIIYTLAVRKFSIDD